MKTTLRLIGDVHGQYDRYVKLASKAEYSVQVGDLGFEYTCLKALEPARHKVLAGNHDNYSKWDTERFIFMQTGHFLGDFGTHEIPGFPPFFFLRGGYSIDHMYRTPEVNWWSDEQLSQRRLIEAMRFYQEKKPHWVITHECPGSLIDAAFGQKTWDGERLFPSMTAACLDRMLCIHRPKYWFFGHHHKAWKMEIEGTTFCCLPELGIVDLKEGELS